MTFLDMVSGRITGRLSGSWVLCIFLAAVLGLAAGPQTNQLETVPSSSNSFTWVNQRTIEGHLALSSSPDGAFSRDGSRLAITVGEKVIILNLQAKNIDKVIEPKLPNLRDLNIESADFVGADKLLLLGTGVIHEKGKRAAMTPMLAFQWDIQQDAVSGKIIALGGSGGFGRPHYFPDIGYIGMYKDSAFTIWNPVSDQSGKIEIPDLQREPNLYTFSPDGHWLLLAQIAASGTPDPIVVRLSEHKFVASLAGHGGTVMSMAFSRDGQWVASGGEDHTVRIWSVESGKLVQTLRESTAPVLTVGFSPNGSFLAATTEHNVLIYQKISTGP